MVDVYVHSIDPSTLTEVVALFKYESEPYAKIAAVYFFNAIGVFAVRVESEGKVIKQFTGKAPNILKDNF